MRTGLDCPNHVDPAEQIGRSAQRHAKTLVWAKRLRFATIEARFVVPTFGAGLFQQPSVAYSENENVPRFSGVPLTEHQPEKLSSKVNILGGHFGVVAAPHPSGTGIPMEYKGVEYSVVQLTDDTGWRWEVRFGDGKNKSGVTPVSRAFAIKLAEYEIDRTLKDRK